MTERYYGDTSPGFVCDSYWRLSNEGQYRCRLHKPVVKKINGRIYLTVGSAIVAVVTGGENIDLSADCLRAFWDRMRDPNPPAPPPPILAEPITVIESISGRHHRYHFHPEHPCECIECSPWLHLPKSKPQPKPKPQPVLRLSLPKMTERFPREYGVLRVPQSWSFPVKSLRVIRLG